MKKTIHSPGNDSGYILVVALVILLILSLLGIFALNSTDIEIQISGNDRVAKETFYRTDGGIQASAEILEQNLSCPDGFQGSTDTIQGIDIYDSRLAHREEMKNIKGTTDEAGNPREVNLEDLPSDKIRAVRILNDPSNGNDNTPHTNITLWGETLLLPGSGLQMAAGYEGKGKGAAGGGAIIDLHVHSQHINRRASEAKITADWRHIIGQEGNCSY